MASNLGILPDSVNDRRVFINAKLRQIRGPKKRKFPRRKNWFKLEKSPCLVTFSVFEPRYR